MEWGSRMVIGLFELMRRALMWRVRGGELGEACEREKVDGERVAWRRRCGGGGVG